MDNAYDPRADVRKGTFTFTDAHTGKEWLNILWNGLGYQTAVTHTGTYTASYTAEDNEKINLNGERTGVVYILDRESGGYFSPGGYPCGRIPENYRCTHAGQYTSIMCEKGGICVEITYAVHPKELCELHAVTLTNRSGRTRSFTAIEGTVFDLGGYPMPFYYNAPTTSATEYVEEANAVLCLSANPYGNFTHKSGFVLSAERPSHTAGNLGDFLGVAGSLAVPEALERGANLPDTFATVRERCGLLQHDITLADGEERTLCYAHGFVEDRTDLLRLAARLRGEFPGIIGRIKGEENPFMGLSTRSPERQINTVMNGWAQKQTIFCGIGKKAVRDNAQLAMAYLNFDPAACKRTLGECFAHQYADGHATLLWYPVSDPDLYSDPAFWLYIAAAEYLKETGDEAFLDEIYPYEDGGEGTVKEHLAAAVNWYTNPLNHGKNGLFKIFKADWNDALNIPDKDAESVFASECVCYLLKEAALLAAHLGDEARARELIEEKNALAARINKAAFNGEYYVRALSAFGKVGDRGAQGGSFYFNPQSWAILSGIVPKDKLPALFAAMDARETDDGVAICVPPYPKYDKTVGRMSGMLPGVYENGGIYNHAGCFKVMADCAAGRAENAVATLLKILPDGKHNPSSHTGLEPYVFSNCYLKHPTVDMRVASSWQTGTSAWGLRCYYEGILGITRRYGGLEIKPCIPQSWQRLTAVRPYRGATLEFEYKRVGKGDKAEVYLDGKKTENGFISADNVRNRAHSVTVCVGEKR